MRTLTGKAGRATLDSDRAPGEGAMERMGGSRDGRGGKKLVGMKSMEMSTILAFEIQPWRAEGGVQAFQTHSKLFWYRNDLKTIYGWCLFTLLVEFFKIEF